MNAMVILRRCREGVEDVERIQQRLARLRSCDASLEAVRLDMAAVQQQLDARTRALDVERVAACRLVDMLPDPACGILYRYYVGGQSQGAIAAALHITTGYYKRKKREGVLMATQISEDAVDMLLPAWYREDYG